MCLAVTVRLRMFCHDIAVGGPGVRAGVKRQSEQVSGDNANDVIPPGAKRSAVAAVEPGQVCFVFLFILFTILLSVTAVAS